MPSLSEELKIVISGDPKKFNKAMDEALASTKRLEAGASAAAKVSGAAFAALTGTITALVYSFREQEVQEQKTIGILKAQGEAASVTSEEVFKLAGALQEATIFGDDMILSAQNMLLGLTKLTKDGFEKASMATLDLATFMGTDATAAAQQLGKALAEPATGLTALSRAGIKFTDEQERMIKALDMGGQRAQAQAMILDILNSRIGGLATNAADGTGKLIQMADVIGDIGEEIGRQFVPVLAKAADVLLPFLRGLAANKEFAKTAAAVLGIGAAVAGIATVFATAVVAVIKWNAVMKAANLSVLALGFSIKGVLIASGLGLLIVIVTDLALNWEKRMAQMTSAWAAFLAVIQKGGAALNDILYGALTGNLSKLKEGLTAMTGIGTVFAETYSKSMKTAFKDTENAISESQIKTTAAMQEGNAQKLMHTLGFLEEMRKLQDEYKNAQIEAQLSANEQELLMEAEHRNQIVELNNEFREAQLQGQLDENTLDVEQELVFQTQMLDMRNELRAAELNSHRQMLLDKAKIQQQADLQFIKDREKFGLAYATINRSINSEEVKGVAQASSELIALQQSRNSTLKAIGKAAAIADITIKTAQSAMNIYNGFSTIPIIGPALGVAGAAAAIAFGAERISQVTAAAEGGLMTGGVPGRDSIPTLTMPGELVVPTKNFEEVVGAVAAQRNGGSGGGSVDVTIGFTDDAFRIIEQKLNERSALGV